MMLNIFWWTICHLYILFCRLCFAHFLMKLFVFLMLSLESSIYIPDSRSLSDMWFANIFSHCVACLFIHLAVSLAENFSNFDEALLIYFFLLVILQLILSLRTLCLPYILQISFLFYFSKAVMIVHVNPLTMLI